MGGEGIIKLSDEDLRTLAAVFDCQVGALPVIVREACEASVMRAATSDEWDEDRLPTYDEYPVVDLDQKRLIFIPNAPARDLMDWLIGAADDFAERRVNGGMGMARSAERMGQALAIHLGYEIDEPIPAPKAAASA